MGRRPVSESWAKGENSTAKNLKKGRRTPGKGKEMQAPPAEKRDWRGSAVM